MLGAAFGHVCSSGDVHVMEEEILQFYRIGAAAAAAATTAAGAEDRGAAAAAATTAAHAEAS
jgi:hypothetical protein